MPLETQTYVTLTLLVITGLHPVVGYKRKMNFALLITCTTYCVGVQSLDWQWSRS